MKRKCDYCSRVAKGSPSGQNFYCFKCYDERVKVAQMHFYGTTDMSQVEEVDMGGGYVMFRRKPEAVYTGSLIFGALGDKVTPIGPETQ